MNKEKTEDVQLAEDIGFGKKFLGKSRLVNPDGSFNLERKESAKRSLYEKLINSSWTLFFIETFIFFGLINLAFASIYFINGVEHLSVAEINPIQDFLNCLYFSIQTFTSVGYGYLNPKNNVANLTASLNAFVGLLGFALATGLLFARFSKPQVNIKFSDNFLTSPLNGFNTLQMRMVNTGNNTLINMEASVTMTWLEEVEQVQRRKFQRLKLELDFIYLFPMNWTLVHKIDENSPLHHLSFDNLRDQNGEILVMVRGFDDTYGQFIFKNHSYHIDALIENATFIPMYETIADKTILYINKLSEFKKL